MVVDSFAVQPVTVGCVRTTNLSIRPRALTSNRSLINAEVVIVLERIHVSNVKFVSVTFTGKQPIISRSKGKNQNVKSAK